MHLQADEFVVLNVAMALVMRLDTLAITHKSRSAEANASAVAGNPTVEHLAVRFIPSEWSDRAMHDL